jgi:tellurite resistance protein TehA-like permease
MDSDTWRRAIRRTLAYAGMIAAAIVFCMLLLRLIAGDVSPPAAPGTTGRIHLPSGIG